MRKWYVPLAVLGVAGLGALLLTDRGFDSAAFLEAVDASGARFLVRLTSTRRLPVMARLISSRSPTS